MRLVLTAMTLGTVFLSATALVPAASLAAKAVDGQASEPVKKASTNDMVASRKRTLLDLLIGSDSSHDSTSGSDDDDSDDDSSDDDHHGGDHSSGDHGGDDHGGDHHGGDSHGGGGHGSDD